MNPNLPPRPSFLTAVAAVGCLAAPPQLLAQTPELVVDIVADGDSGPGSAPAARYPTGELLFSARASATDLSEAVWVLREGVAEEVFVDEDFIAWTFVVDGTGYFTTADSLYRVADDFSRAEALPYRETNLGSRPEGGRVVFDSSEATAYLYLGGEIRRIGPEGVGEVELADGKSVEGDLSAATAVPYGEGIALAAEVRDTLWLWSIDGGEATVLASVPDYNSLRGVEALHRLGDGLLVVIDEQPLVYRPGSGELTEMLVDGAERELTNTGGAGGFGVLAYLSGEGFRLIRDLDGNSDLLLEAPSGGSVFDQDLIPTTSGTGGLAFTYSDDANSDDFLVVSDGTAAGTQTRGIDAFPGDFLTEGDAAVVRVGGVNGFESALVFVDLAEATYTLVNMGTTRATEPVALEGEELYLWADADEAAGYELYRLDVGAYLPGDDPSAVWDGAGAPAFEVRVVAGGVTVVHTEALPAEVVVYDAAGREVERVRGVTNAVVELPAVAGGVGFVTAVVGGERVTVRYVELGLR